MRKRLSRACAGAYSARARHEGKISDREILYRSAFEMGRHIIGYEVQKVLAGVDWFSKDAAAKSERKSA